MPRDRRALNIQAGRVALELLAWDKARTGGYLDTPGDPAERLIEKGAGCYQRLLRALHGEHGDYSLREGDDWVDASEAKRRNRPYMTKKWNLLARNELLLHGDDLGRLDHLHPELRFSGRPSRGPADSGDVAGQLERLGALHAGGLLTDDEFAAAKARVLE